jgi:hypothetical protein
METQRPPLRSVRLLDQVRERIRYCHYSLRTEQAYDFWVRRFIRFHQLRHPRQMGALEVEAFHLAADRNAAPSTHKEALAALLFRYRQVLDIDLARARKIASSCFLSGFELPYRPSSRIHGQSGRRIAPISCRV